MTVEQKVLSVIADAIGDNYEESPANIALEVLKALHEAGMEVEGGHMTPEEQAQAWKEMARKGPEFRPTAVRISMEIARSGVLSSDSSAVMPLVIDVLGRIEEDDPLPRGLVAARKPETRH